MDCPKDVEALRHLLAKPPGDPERDSIEAHRKTCRPCDTVAEDLLRRGDTVITSGLQGVNQQPEDESVRAALARIKQLPPPEWIQPSPHDGARGAAPPAPPGNPAQADLPEVPGYEILDELGRGGMGVVYKARQASLDRVVALKMILDGDYGELATVARFQNEAKLLARMEHPNIVQILEVGEHASRPYFAMEFVDGGSLDKKLNGTPLPARQAAGLLETLARAIHAAHERGVIHRDLKPANILLTSGRRKPVGDGEPSGSASLPLAWAEYTPKVTDFGLAKRLDSQPGQTQTGAIMGTPRYMAPEQAAGRSKDVGPATDVHALGAILYELLTGRPPFLADSLFDNLQQVRFQEPVAPSRLQPKVSRDLETICLKCLQKSPTNRYLSAEALAEDLRRFLNGEPIHARPISALERAWRWCRRKPVVASLTAAVLAAVLGSILLSAALWYNAELRARAVQNLAQAEDDLRAKREEVRQLEQQGQKERRHLEESRAAARRVLYMADLNMAQLDWDNSNVSRMLDLLQRHRPRPGQEDLRGFEWYHLWRLCHLDQTTLHGQMGSVRSLAFSPDGRTLAAACMDGKVYLWDESTKRVRLLLQGHANPVLSVAFAPDGKTLATGGGEWWRQDKPGELKLWDAEKGQERAVLEGHTGTVNCVAFSRDTSMLASASHDGTARVWDVTKRKQVSRIPVRGEEPVTSVAFAPDGLTLAAGTVNGFLLLWDLAAGKRKGSLHEHQGPIWSVAFSPDGRLIATTGSDDSTTRVWDPAAKSMKTLHGHRGGVVSVKFSPDGKTLATGGADQRVILWETSTGRRLFDLKGHRSLIWALAFSPDGKVLATGTQRRSGTGEVRLWNVTSDPKEERLVMPAHPVLSVAFGPDGRTLAVAGARLTVQLWDTATRKEQASLKGYTNTVWAVVFTPDGKTLVTGGSRTDAKNKPLGGEIRWWSVPGGEQRRTLELPSTVYSMALSTDAKTLAAGCEDGTVKLLDLASGEELAVLVGAQNKNEIRSVAFSPDGGLLATGGTDKTAKLWDISQRRVQLTLEGHHSTVWSVAFAPDGKRLATGSVDDTAKLWDLQTGRELATLRGHFQGVRAVRFHPRGKRLATASGDNTVKLWDVATGEERATLRGQSSGIWSLAFSPDGNTLAAGDMKGIVNIWRAATEEEVRARDE
jgi:WD40 repeat protein/serine/threonine protein kinase